MSGGKSTALVKAKRRLPTISVVVSFPPRPGFDGSDIVTRATVNNDGKEHELRSYPDCTYAMTLPRTLSITVWLKSSDDDTR
jgi:hypothetical protein